ncbi:MAG: nucleotide exchange factor GrpE [Gemmatimonadales bacterium]
MNTDDREPKTEAAESSAEAGGEAAPREGPPPAETGAAELAELNDKYLRLAADFDNFRKRMARERAEVWVRAQADLIQRLVDALDDLARFAHVDPAQTDATTIHDGVDMVERKIWKELETAGVKRIDQVGVPFDPNLHEAVSTVPAPAPDQDHTVASLMQAGYQLGPILIRPARVVVRTWSGAPPPADG